MNESRGAGADSAAAPTRALHRGLRILDLLATQSDDSGLRITDIAAAVELDKATTTRLLQTLIAVGYVYQEPDSKVYRLTGKLLRLAGAFESRLEVPRRIRPALARLRDDTGLTVHFGVRVGDRVTYLLKLESSAPVVVASAVGQSMPLTTTSLGKSILAALPVDELEDIVATLPFERRTERSIVDDVALHRELERTRRRGYAVDDRENEYSISCVGSAVLDARGTVLGAISAAGPSYVVAGRFEELGIRCRETADAVRELL